MSDCEGFEPIFTDHFMKQIIHLLLTMLCLMGVVHAELLAHVDTTEGRVTVSLQYDEAPLAVANFITLAEGTRPHVDAATGALSTKPFYVGESFFRVINDTGFRIAQTGSGTGTNSGGPGYTFKDEFDPTLRHVPYVLSMANSGPNSNGSQIFFVGNSTPSHLDDVHTVFGIITETASRLVIDSIHAAGSNGSSIQAISFERTDPLALAFDELAQPLPEVSSISGSLSVTPGAPVHFTPNAPFTSGHKVSIFRSENLATWVQQTASFFGYDNTPAVSARIGTATSPRAFYQIAAIRYPDSPSPALMANRTLVVNAPGAGGIITFAFDASGNGGTVHYSGSESLGTILGVMHTPEGYGATLIVESTTLIPLLIKLAYDEDELQLAGRHTLSGWNGFQWTSYGSGTFTLTK